PARRQANTHAYHTAELAYPPPTSSVDHDLYHDADPPIYTSAGTAAGIYLCLHLVRQEHGSATATALARRMVVPPHRAGGQAQYVEAPVPRTACGPTLEPLLSWLVTTLDRDHTVDSLAARA